MTLAILGGLGLFLLGMSTMTEGLRSLAGSTLRTVLTRAAASPTKGMIWGALVTLIVQSSSATTMTTIGLVSAGLLSFSQAIGVVFGANLGTTGTGWLVALVGVKFSLTAASMPLVFVGAFLRLLGKGRWSAVGSAAAGFALLLIGLSALQEGMAGLATRINPGDLPSVAGLAEGEWWAVFGLFKLVIAGIVMTTVMQSSSASVAATLSALHAGAIGPDQAAALVIGQNIGSAVSSAIAAIGATIPARRTAAAHVLFNVFTAIIALGAFPYYAPLILRVASGQGAMNPTILIATFHTLYNAIGVAILLPMVRPFSRSVERLVPTRGPVFVRFLDPATLAIPPVAVEAARRTIAFTLHTLCDSVVHAMERAAVRGGRADLEQATVREAGEALHHTRLFLAGLAQPPATDSERERLTGVLHALDHTTRLTDNIESLVSQTGADALWIDPDLNRAVDLTKRSLEVASAVAWPAADLVGPPVDPESRLAELAQSAAELAELRRTHRRGTFGAAAELKPSAGVDDAITRIDRMRLLDRLSYHAWRAATHAAGAAAR